MFQIIIFFIILQTFNFILIHKANDTVTDHNFDKKKFCIN